MKMKKTYEAPQMNIEALNQNDTITASIGMGVIKTEDENAIISNLSLWNL